MWLKDFDPNTGMKMKTMQTPQRGNNNRLRVFSLTPNSLWLPLHFPPGVWVEVLEPSLLRHLPENLVTRRG